MIYVYRIFIRRMCYLYAWLAQMGNVTVSVPEEIRRRMKRLKHVNWSEVARKAFEERIRREEMLKAAEGMDRLRQSSQTKDWSGAKEIRRWRDAAK